MDCSLVGACDLRTENLKRDSRKFTVPYASEYLAIMLAEATNGCFRIPLATPVQSGRILPTTDPVSVPSESFT